MHPNETGIYAALLAGLLVLLFLVALLVFSILRIQRKKVAFHYERIKDEFNFLDKERERIAADLHDDMGASLSAVKIRLQCIKNTDEDGRAILKFAELHIDEIMNKLRTIAFNMMPGVLQRQGLNEALKYLTGTLTHSTGIKVNYHYSLDSVDKEKSVHLYRIAQEVLNNSIKHARANTITVSTRRLGRSIQFHISDDGTGFNRKKIEDGNKGLGLKNIVSRAGLLNAKVYLTTSPGNGVDYLIEIPG